MSDSLAQKEKYPVQNKKAEVPDYFAPWKSMNSFFEFRHTVFSISNVGGKTRIEARENRFIDGKLETEKFEANMGLEIYENAARDFCGAYLDMLSRLMKSFSIFNPFLPFERKDKQIK